MLNLELKADTKNAIQLTGVSHCFHGTLDERTSKPLTLQLDCLQVYDGNHQPNVASVVNDPNFPKAGELLDYVALSNGDQSTHYFWKVNGWAMRVHFSHPFYLGLKKKGLWLSIRFEHTPATNAKVPFKVNKAPSPGAKGLDEGNTVGVLNPSHEKSNDKASDVLHGVAIGNPASEFLHDYEQGQIFRDASTLKFARYAKRHTKANSVLLDSIANLASNLVDPARKTLERTLDFTEPTDSSVDTKRTLDTVDRVTRQFNFSTGGTTPSLKRILFCEYDGYFQGNIRIPSVQQLARQVGSNLADHPMISDPGYFYDQLPQFDFSDHGRVANYAPIEVVTILAQA